MAANSSPWPCFETPALLALRRAPQHEEFLAAHRRHVELVALAGALVDLGALAELQLARQTDAHFAQARPAAGHRDAGGAHAGVGLDEGLLHLVGRHRQRRFRLEVFGRDLYARARLA